MPSVLPTKPVAPSRINPKLLITYGLPKVGKTTELTKLESNLILDTEGGAESVAALRVPVKYIDGPTVINDKGELTAISFTEVFNDMLTQAKEYTAANPGKKMPRPYRRISIDTLDKFEEYCTVAATIDYKNSVIGKKFEGDNVLDLPNGAGYYHLRNKMIEKIEFAQQFCETLILNCHTKDKIVDVGGVELTSKDLSLTGKLGGILAAKADAIIYWYRVQNKPLMASLETTNNGGVMGARPFPHFHALLGQKFEFSWDKIFIDPTK